MDVERAPDSHPIAVCVIQLHVVYWAKYFAWPYNITVCKNATAVE